MTAIRNFIHQGLLLSCIIFLIFFSSSYNLFAEEIEWLEVSKTNNELLSINPDSIKYNNNGFLSVLAKYSEIDPDNESIVNSDSFLMAIDCENRLFSKFPVNSDVKQVKSWETPINNKLIKKSIINSCKF
ncbi:hypothetical protein [Prochlorococcus marinus]|uniref:hypothetical protein n=1 Tax=Prochlorococcus marinus TaxID=1219 RepID=UPI0022B50281|nr:hypothetical protein [Prochlorococcus marinus]